MLSLLTRFVTPLIALTVLAAALSWVKSVGEAQSFSVAGLFRDVMPSFFLAEILFCSIILLVVGQLLSEVVWPRETNQMRIKKRR
jgi:hypothetical protein